MQLHFEKLGTGPPLIVLHGLFGALDNWQPLNRRFAERFQVFAVDQRNHGHSPQAPEMTYAAMAEDIRELMDREGLVNARLLGHSMGGKTAMELALAHPGRVSGLIVVDMAPRRYPPQHRAILDAMLGLQLERYQSRPQLEAALAGAIAELAVRRFLLKSVGRDRAGRFFWRLGLKQINASYHHLLEGLAPGRRFNGPALFVRAERSDYLQEQDWELIRQYFPAAVLNTVSNAGHWVHADAPNAVATAVLNFLG